MDCSGGLGAHSGFFWPRLPPVTHRSALALLRLEPNLFLPAQLLLIRLPGFLLRAQLPDLRRRSYETPADYSQRAGEDQKV
jgi:hypothetical protein